MLIYTHPNKLVWDSLVRTRTQTNDAVEYSALPILEEKGAFKFSQWV